MSTSLATLRAEPKEELVNKLARARATLKSMKEGTKHGVGMVKIQVLAGAGGAFAGWVSVKHPTINLPVLGPTPTEQVVGAVLAAISIFDLADGYDEDVAYVAAGLMGATAAKKVATLVSR
jgi:hypothetical protein